MCDRCLRSRRGVLSIANRPPAFCRRNNLRNRAAGFGNESAKTAPLESQNRSRAGNDLSQVPGERSKASLSLGACGSRRFGTLAKARANPREANWIFHVRTQMGATESKHDRVSHVAACARSRSNHDYLES